MRYWVEHDRERNKWRARIVLDNGSRGPSRRFKTKREANDWLAEQRTAATKGIWVDSRKGKLVLKDFLPTYANTQVNLESTTLLRKESGIRNWILPTFGHRPLGEITQTEVQAWVAECATKLNPGTVESNYQTLSQILASAVEAGLIQRSPCSKARGQSRGIIRPKYRRPEQRFLSLTQLLGLADAITPMYRSLVLTGGTGGLRIGEMAGLRRENVDLFGGTLNIVEQLRLVNGRPEMAPLKTAASRRVVRLPQFALQDLRHHMKVFEPGPGNTVFSSWEGFYVRAYQFRRRHFEPAGQLAGLGHITPHALRHTAVSMWIAGGANAKQVMRWAGHSSIKVTYDTYGHLFPGDEEKISEQMDAAFAQLGDTAKVIPLPGRNGER